MIYNYRKAKKAKGFWVSVHSLSWFCVWAFIFTDIFNYFFGFPSAIFLLMLSVYYRMNLPIHFSLSHRCTVLN